MSGYIDFHSHILPSLDDGPKDVSVSVEMAKKYISEGVSTVICTPHYINSKKNSVDNFIKNRRESFDLLKNELQKQNITGLDFRLGAEVNFNCDLCTVEGIEKLAIENTNYILIEMPNGPWQDGMFDYLYALIAQKNLFPIIAHMERYEQSDDIMKKLLGLEVLFQVNISSFKEKGEKKNVMKLLKGHHIQLIGTDAHNMTTRPPLMHNDIEYLKKKISPDFVRYLYNTSYDVLNNEEIEYIGNYSYNYKRRPGFFKKLFK